MPPISKSRYLAFLQCPGTLWACEQETDESSDSGEGQEQYIYFGNLIGQLARKLYPDGIEVKARGIDNILQNSKELLRARKPIFEAGFIYNGGFARADILVPADKEHWDIIEVKSATRVKDYYLSDLAFQKYIYTGAGLKIRDCYIMHINNAYVRNGDLDPASLLIKEKVNDQVNQNIKSVPSALQSAKGVLAGKQCPSVKIGPHCGEIFACPLSAECWASLPEHNLLELYHYNKKQAWELIDQGITSLTKLPKGTKLNDKQKIQIDCVRTGQPHIASDELAQWLKTLIYPLYFLDFETIFPAVPVWDDTRPYQQVPFQFSLHVAMAPGAKIAHYEYLHDEIDDPRPYIMDKLRSFIGAKGTLVAYNMSFEKSRLKEMAEAFPSYSSWVNQLLPRFIDLLVPFRAFHYYHPDQHGSCSIKAVLPVLTNISYKDLAIGDGGSASWEYYRTHILGEGDKQAVRKRLLEYCGVDT